MHAIAEADDPADGAKKNGGDHERQRIVAVAGIGEVSDSAGCSPDDEADGGTAEGSQTGVHEPKPDALLYRTPVVVERVGEGSTEEGASDHHDRGRGFYIAQNILAEELAGEKEASAPSQ